MEELNVKELIEYYISKLSIIVLTVICSILIGCAYIEFYQTKMYHGKTTVILTDSESATTYSKIITSRKLVNEVINNLDLDIDTEELTEQITVNTILETPIIEILVSYDSSNKAAIIANEIVDVFKQEAKELYNIENISIIDKAIPEDEPYNVNILKQMIMYVFIGLISGVLIIFIMYYFDNTIKNSKQIEEKFTIPVLGNISSKSRTITNIQDNKSLIEELNLIKTNLSFETTNQKLKKLLITSSIPKEGKSFIAASLATNYATNNQKVLLIDCDLRSEYHQELLNSSKSSSLGLSDLILNNNVEKNLKKYIKPTTIKNFDILISGTITSNPLSLLESDILDKLITKLEKEYDLIIFDAPPVLNLSDTLIISRLVDASIVVAKAKRTTMDQLNNTISILKKRNINIPGIIFNNIKGNKRQEK